MEINIEPAKMWRCDYCGIRMYGFTDRIVYNAIYNHLDQSHSQEEDVPGKLDALYDMMYEKQEA